MTRPAVPPPPDLTERTRNVERLCYEWYSTTHADRFEHDHHCAASRWESPGVGTRANSSTYPLSSVQVETGKPCTCGWGPFQEAEAALLSDTEASRE